jgi:hypothetical protein
MHVLDLVMALIATAAIEWESFLTISWYMFYRIRYWRK